MDIEGVSSLLWLKCSCFLNFLGWQQVAGGEFRKGDGLRGLRGLGVMLRFFDVFFGKLLDFSLVILLNLDFLKVNMVVECIRR